MMHMKTKTILLVSTALPVSACEQAQAPIQDLGKQYYGSGSAPANNAYNNDTSSSYPHYNSSYSNTPVESAAVPTVGMSDLPPAGSTPAPGATPSSAYN